MTGVFAVLAVAALFGACGEDGPRPVSEADAREVLDDAVALGLRGDDELCQMASAVKLCEGILRRAAVDRPAEAPRVVGVRTIESKGDQVGGTVLELEGATRSGRPYRSDFLVVDTGDGPRPHQPVWWAGIAVAQSRSES